MFRGPMQRAFSLPPQARSLARSFAAPLTGLALVASSTGCSQEVELPDPPDMAALVQAYRAPNGKIDSQTAASFGKTMAATVESGQSSSPVEVVGEMVHEMQDVGGGEATTASDDAGSGEQSVRGSRIDLSAIVRLDHTCRGWGDTRTDDPANGTFDMTVTLDQAGMIPTVWGTLNGCRTQRADNFVELDGNVRIHFGDNQPRVGLRYLTQVGYLIEYEGKVKTTRGGTLTELDVHSHFQISANRELRFLINLGDGTNVIGIVDPDTIVPTNANPTAQVAVLERDGQRWTCIVDIRNATGSCTSQASPPETVTW
jgi:hypothetical protein